MKFSENEQVKIHSSKFGSNENKVILESLSCNLQEVLANKS